jgi:hypothetical protein
MTFLAKQNNRRSWAERFLFKKQQLSKYLTLKNNFFCKSVLALLLAPVMSLQRKLRLIGIIVCIHVTKPKTFVWKKFPKFLNHGAINFWLRDVFILLTFFEKSICKFSFFSTFPYLIRFDTFFHSKECRSPLTYLKFEWRKNKG